MKQIMAFTGSQALVFILQRCKVDLSVTDKLHMKFYHCQYDGEEDYARHQKY